MKLDLFKRNLLLGGLIVGAIGMVATAARAGKKVEYPVATFGILYDPGTGVPVPATQITGQVGSVRATADAVQYIGCYAAYDSQFSGNTAFCYARTAAGTTYNCTNTTADFKAAVRSINPQSYISFIYLNGASSCNNLTVENGSTMRTSAP